MQSISTVNQSIFNNKQVETGDRKNLQSNNENTNPKAQKILEGELLKVGDTVTQQQAEDIFERTHIFQDLSYQAQHGLKAYVSHELDYKRQALKETMGVDLYA